MLQSSLIHLDQKNFRDELLRSKGVVVVEFTSAACAPCRTMDSLLEELSAQYGEQIRFVRLDVQENFDIALDYNIIATPTLLIFKNSELVSKFVGLEDAETIRSRIESMILQIKPTSTDQD